MWAQEGVKYGERTYIGRGRLLRRGEAQNANRRRDRSRAAKVSRLRKPPEMSARTVADHPAEAVLRGSRTFASRTSAQSRSSPNSPWPIPRRAASIAWPFGGQGWAMTTVRVRISPSTRWGPANTSNGSSASSSTGPAARGLLAGGFHPVYSEVYLRYGAQRVVVFRPGVECPAGLHKLVADYFDGRGVLRSGAYGRFDVFLKQAGAFAP